MITIWPARRVGLLQVLRAQQHPWCPPPASDRDRPTRISDRLRGSRPVVGSSRNSTAGVTIRAGDQVEPCVASRRTTSSPGRPPRVGQTEALEQLRGPAPLPGACPGCCMSPRMSRFSLPVRVVVRRPRAGRPRPDDPAHLPWLAGTTVVAGPPGRVRRRGLVSVASTAGRRWSLPAAPFRARAGRRHCPGVRPGRIPAQVPWTLPKDFRRASPPR